MRREQGMIYVFEGNGKGKTSAALGVTVRMLLLEKTVVWISWFKEELWNISEMKLPKKFNNLKMYWGGKGFFGGPDDHNLFDTHVLAARSAVDLAKSVLKDKKTKGKKVDLLVLDEVIRAVNDKLIKIDDVLELIKMRGGTHLVLTGHDCPLKIREVADLVTEMKKMKHPYDKGIMAVSGLDF